MENKNISQIAIERIKEEKIKPISRKVFNLKKIFFWTAVVLSLIIGAFMFSLVLSGLFNNDWDLYDRFGFNFIFKTLPYFWLGSLVVFTVLGEYYYRQTLFGYRHTIIVVVGVYMAFSILFGSAFYIIGASDFFEKALVDVTPVYRNIIFNRGEVWTHPEKGLLSGKITEVSDDEIKIVDGDGLIWTVNVNSLSDRDDLNLKINDQVKVTGDIMDDNFFIAEELRFW